MKKYKNKKKNNNLNLSVLDNEITFIIVTYQSNKIINKCINSLPKKCKKIVVENSKNKQFAKILKKKFNNIKVIIPRTNLGYGAANNLGIKKTKTKFAFIINPDVIFLKNSFREIKKAIIALNKDFDILSPNINSKNLIIDESNKNIKKVDQVLGSAMLFNLGNDKNDLLFDENIFLFMEEIDLCRKVTHRNGKIYIAKNAHIIHYGKRSVNYTLRIEALRNWHYMWSYFYFNRKHLNYIFAFFMSFKFIVRYLFDLFLSILIFNQKKFFLSKYRILGIINSLFGSKSYLRLNHIL